MLQYAMLCYHVSCFVQAVSCLCHAVLCYITLQYAARLHAELFVTVLG